MVTLNDSFPDRAGDSYPLVDDLLLQNVPMEDGRKVLGGCLLEYRLGRGGMATVYKGRHKRLKIAVAVKVLSRQSAEEDSRFIMRFLREAQAAATISHTNLVRVYDVNQEAGVYFIVQEYVSGGTVARLLRRRETPLEESRALRIVRDAASGLAEAHSAGIVHRDVKPDNILLDERGRAKVSDLGLAKALIAGPEEDEYDITRYGTTVGTPTYMSPEQCRDSKKIDHRTDIYSLGVTLYNITTAKRPYTAEGLLPLLRKISSEPYPDPRIYKPDLSAETAAIINCCMQKNPDDRFENCEALIEAIDRILSRSSVEITMEKEEESEPDEESVDTSETLEMPREDGTETPSSVNLPAAAFLTPSPEETIPVERLAGTGGEIDLPLPWESGRGSADGEEKAGVSIKNNSGVEEEDNQAGTAPEHAENAVPPDAAGGKKADTRADVEDKASLPKGKAGTGGDSTTSDKSKKPLRISAAYRPDLNVKSMEHSGNERETSTAPSTPRERQVREGPVEAGAAPANGAGPGRRDSRDASSSPKALAAGRPSHTAPGAIHARSDSLRRFSWEKFFHTLLTLAALGIACWGLWYLYEYVVAGRGKIPDDEAGRRLHLEEMRLDKAGELMRAGAWEKALDMFRKLEAEGVSFSDVEETAYGRCRAFVEYIKAADEAGLEAGARRENESLENMRWRNERAVRELAVAAEKLAGKLEGRDINGMLKPGDLPASRRSKMLKYIDYDLLRDDDGGITVNLPFGQEIKFIRVPKGEFIMGGGPESGKNPAPPHKVVISRDFFLADTELTRRQFAAVTGFPPPENAPPPVPDGIPEWSNADNFAVKIRALPEGNRPVTWVSWNTAAAFAKMIDSRIPNASVSLPTEACWEYAAVEGSPVRPRVLPDWIRRDFSSTAFKDWLDSHAVRDTPELPPVASKRPNSLGIYDQLGSVWEWCADYYHRTSPPQSEVVVDPVETGQSPFRVRKGGSFLSSQDSMETTPATRCGDRPESFGEDFGVRLMLVPDGY